MRPTRDVAESLASGERRLGGHLIDDVLFTIVLFIGVVIGEVLTGRAPDIEGLGGMLGGALWLIWSLVVARRGQSPGKQLVNTRVVLADGRPSGLVRTIVRRELLLVAVLVSLVLTLGFAGLTIAVCVLAMGGLWCLFDVNRQCLWDKMAGTYVVAIEDHERQVGTGNPPSSDPWREETLTALRNQGVISEEEYSERGT